MPEAIIAVVDRAFTQPWVSRVWAACEVETVPRPRRWKRLDSAARAFYPSFQCIPTSRRHLVLATRTPAALNRAAGELSVIGSQEEGRSVIDNA